MLDSLPQIWDFFSLVVSQLIGVWLNNAVISAFFALWLLDRIFGIFDKIRGQIYVCFAHHTWRGSHCNYG